ncbi:helix-turn-helix domain-containing protein [Hyphomicrobium sp.]|uniref:helix-turn-helix domain-containing protein n=1 Tax=Hyphomicrobium sp. TaxID=82 RepID=UPI002CA27F0C|nr:helix-turn-helix domain-containing protein [Hyphomicrobium sp.]HRN88585.1 helix-turn-helix domain-containing protein [Hyphomicrobium sp.]HRQ27158.1 helix-turn-helix domain-containing protein [Hyphomicrobium sp.]
MRKAFMGVRLRRLREERGLTQVALARALDLSASYLNQLEKNQRPLTVPILLKINAVFGVDVQLFSEDEEARLIADLRDVLADPGLDEEIALTEIREIASNMPSVGRAIVKQHRRLRQASERADALATRLGVGTEEQEPAQLMPFEQVRDYFYAHHNYFAELDEAAERLFATARLNVGDCASGLKRYLSERLRIQVVIETPNEQTHIQRSFDAPARVLRLSSTLTPGQVAFE